MSETELAWAAGFFDGEGYTGLNKYTTKTKKGGTLDYWKRYPTVNIAQTLSSELLDRFNKATGDIGKVYGPYGPYAANKKQYWQYQASGYEQVKTVISTLYPYMSSVKKEQADDVLKRYLEQGRPI